MGSHDQAEVLKCGPELLVVTGNRVGVLDIVHRDVDRLETHFRNPLRLCDRPLDGSLGREDGDSDQSVRSDSAKLREPVVIDLCTRLGVLGIGGIVDVELPLVRVDNFGPNVVELLVFQAELWVARLLAGAVLAFVTGRTPAHFPLFDLLLEIRAGGSARLGVYAVDHVVITLRPRIEVRCLVRELPAHFGSSKDPPARRCACHKKCNDVPSFPWARPSVSLVPKSALLFPLTDRNRNRSTRRYLSREHVTVVGDWEQTGCSATRIWLRLRPAPRQVFSVWSGQRRGIIRISLTHPPA